MAVRDSEHSPGRVLRLRNQFWAHCFRTNSSSYSLTGCAKNMTFIVSTAMGTDACSSWLPSTAAWRSASCSCSVSTGTAVEPSNSYILFMWCRGYLRVRNFCKMSVHNRRETLLMQVWNCSSQPLSILRMSFLRLRFMHHPCMTRLSFPSGSSTKRLKVCF